MVPERPPRSPAGDPDDWPAGMGPSESHGDGPVRRRTVRRWFTHPIATTAACVLLAVPAILALAAAPLAGAADPTAQEEGPKELMVGLSTRLFAMLDRDRSKIRQQPARALSLVDELLSAHFDAEATARLVLGTHWRTATPEQRQRFASALYRTLLSTYAGAVVEWTAEQFRILPQRGDLAASQVVVRTEVARLDASAVAVDYRMHRTAEGWKIFDVIVDGVSYARSYHDDIDGEIKQNGLDAAITRLEKARNGAVVTAHSPPGT